MDKYRDSFHHLSISIDGAVASTHGEIRQRKGAFDLAIASLRRYVPAGCIVKISMVLNQRNKHEMDAMVNLACELGVNSINFWRRNFSLME
jgi:MoaA/NifB/PqqE/SkfB family radical SAM enzyme